ncbi:MAG: HDIG domain-containing metalloprotein [Solirubrobacteraceae bacterium]
MKAPLQQLEAINERAWVVGGAVRDELLGRATLDYDVAIEGDARAAARELARRAGAHAFALSDAFGAWRVVARDHSWQVDLTPLMGETLERDLARRDLTINAIARPLNGGAAIDPFGGVADLRAARLRMVSPDAFSRDPLRTLRLARLAAELGFAIQRETLAAAAASSAALRAVAAERVFTELKQIVACERVIEGLALMETLGATEAVLPELTALHGVTQSAYHHLDVHDHTIAVLAATLELQRDPSAVLGVQAEPITAVLSQPLANELTRGVALRFGALLHDAAKPQTRARSADGRITFIGHDQAGAALAAAVMSRLRASERLSAHVQALTRNHLRLGFLVHEVPLGRRAIYRYMRACEPVEVDVTLLSVADRLATRGRGSDAAISRHLALARELLEEALRWRAQRPQPPLRGDRLAREVGIRPGPELGRVLAELEEAAYAGEVQTEEQALRRARELLGRPAAAEGPRGPER